MSVRQRKATGLVCFWEWKDGERYDPKWKLAGSCLIDEDGYTVGKAFRDCGGEQGWRKWMDLEKTEDHFVPHMGRALTMWSRDHGVSLMDINPPDEFPKWLSSSFYEAMCKLDNWALLLQNGSDLWFGTLEEVESRIFSPGETP